MRMQAATGEVVSKFSVSGFRVTVFAFTHPLHLTGATNPEWQVQSANLLHTKRDYTLAIMTLWQLVSNLDGLANGSSPVPHIPPGLVTPPESTATVPPISLLVAKTYLKLAKWLESYRSMVDLNLLREEGMCLPGGGLSSSGGPRNHSTLLLHPRVSHDAIMFAAENLEQAQERVGQHQEQSVQWLVGAFFKRATHARPVAVAEANFCYGRCVLFTLLRLSHFDHDFYTAAVLDLDHYCRVVYLQLVVSSVFTSAGTHAIPEGNRHRAYGVCRRTLLCRRSAAVSVASAAVTARRGCGILPR